MKIAELKAINEQIEKEKAKIERINKKIAKLDTERKENCKHPKKYIIHRSRYNSGGYDYTAYTEYWDVCDLCNIESEIKTVNHGTYG